MPVPWLEAQALFLLELMLQQCQTQYELGKLLQLLAAAENLLLDGEESMEPSPSASCGKLSLPWGSDPAF